MDTIIERIKKLIALSQDSGATEHEKLTALKHAEKLMLKYSISEFSASSEEPEIVEVPFQLDREIFYLDTKKLCYILGIVGENFGCYSSFSLNGSVKLFGFRVNCEIVEYTAKVLISQGLRDCAVGWKINPSASYKMTFWKGFIQGLEDRFNKIKLSEETGITVYDKVKEFFDKRVTFSSDFSMLGANYEAAQAGNKSAREAVVNPALSSSTSEGKKLL
jgi:hypothetical protein